MRNRWLVTFTCEKEDGTFYQVVNEVDSLVKVTRLILSFQPKKKSKLVQINIDDILTLF